MMNFRLHSELDWGRLRDRTRQLSHVLGSMLHPQRLRRTVESPEGSPCPSSPVDPSKQRLLSTAGPVLVAALLLVSLSPAGAEPVQLPGLRGPAWIAWDQQGVPHITALRELDSSFLVGYVHARDRFFQMDSLRRQFSGRSAELLGPPVLPADIQFRAFGLRRSAEATLPELSGESRRWLEAYADGVNAYLESQPLPPEYDLLELTSAQVPAWTVVDSLTIAKGILASFSFDLSDLRRSTILAAYQAVGSGAGFDGTALLFSDLDPFAPFDPAVSIPGAGQASTRSGSAAGARAGAAATVLEGFLGPEALDLARGYIELLESQPTLSGFLSPDRRGQGSNWWLVSGRLSSSGEPLFSSDPHRGLTSPAGPYEVHLRAPRQKSTPSLNATGLSFPGVPALIQGCTARVCWGNSFHAGDVTDIYQETLVIDPASGLPTHTVFRGQQEPIVVLPQSFLINQIGDGVADNLAPANVPPNAGGLTFVVPRRNNGPIIAIDTSAFPRVVGLSVQYTGSGPSQEIECFRRLLKAQNLGDVRRALQFFDVGAQNWAAADTRGDIAFWVSGEIPLREDLQTLGRPDGAPPFLLRDGTGAQRHEWLEEANPAPDQALPFQVLPFAELPQVRNPSRGFVWNANNDPVGRTLDNDPLNDLRPGGGLFYLGFTYASLRAGRLEELFDEALAGGRKLDLDDMKSLQADNRLRDAQLLVPFILEAFQAATASGAPPSLAALGQDPGVVEAVGRLGAWDFSTPTGIREGYDAGDDPEALPEPTAEEVDASVAASIYAIWRSQMLSNSVDAALNAVGLGNFKTVDLKAWQGVYQLLRDFDDGQGVGASGLRLIPLAPDSPDPAAGRDLTILQSLRAGLDQLASGAFAPAFQGSTDQGDYRWGLLHRIVFQSPLGSPFSIPEGGGFENLGPQLPGIARSGGLSTLDAASHLIFTSDSNGFMFRSGPDNRFIARLGRRGIRGQMVLAGGQSARPGSPFQADQLHLWLTNQYRPVLFRQRDIFRDLSEFQIFLPAGP